MRLFPSRKQWKNWSLPNKITAISFYLAVLGIVLTVLFFLKPYHRDGSTDKKIITYEEKPTLELKLFLRIGGFEVTVSNIGNITAKQIYVDLVSWAVGAPGVEAQETYQVHDLSPKADYTFHVEPIKWEHYSEESIEYRKKRPTSGYLVILCSNADRPRAWAFYIPEERTYKQEEYVAVFYSVPEWPIVEFDYPENKPYLQCVNYPIGVCNGLPLGYGIWNPKDQIR